MLAQQKKTYGFFLIQLQLELLLDMIRAMVFFGMEWHGKTLAPYAERSARKARKARKVNPEQLEQLAQRGRKAQQDQTETMESTERTEQMVPPVLTQ
jgi:hypothetical protein